MRVATRGTVLLMALAAAMAVAALGLEQGGGRRGGGPDEGRGRPSVLPSAVAARSTLSVVLGRPTDRSVTANLLSRDALEARVQYGAVGGERREAGPVSLQPGMPADVLLDGLPADAECSYRVEAGAVSLPEQRFHTQRASGGAFTFELQGDSHPERAQQFDPALYVQALSAAAADRPDFYILIGDDFSVDTLRLRDAESILGVYRRQRLYLSLIGETAPLFLVNGNHEQASMANLDGTPQNVAVLAQNGRNGHFPQPAPDGFYTGDPQEVEHIGLLRDYYAWTWGDALFVAIDPYWHSPTTVDNALGSRDKAGRDLWDVTLGEEQYRWLAQTLEGSTARWKFVFTHHVLGTGRGGIECARGYEWGGLGPSGRDEFAARRPGWELPIHQLLAQNGVSIVFQGHDHIFVRQELDGVVYQTLPEPADPNYALYNADAFRTGERLPNSGRVRVTVAPKRVSVEYVRSRLPRDATAESPDGEVACHYTLPSQP